MTEPLTDEELRQAKHGNLVENHIDRLIATIDKLTAERNTAYERAAVACEEVADLEKVVEAMRSDCTANAHCPVCRTSTGSVNVVLDLIAIIDKLTAERDALRAALVPFCLSPFHPPKDINPEQWAKDVGRAYETIRALKEDTKP